MRYLTIKSCAFSTQPSGVYGVGNIEFWFIAAGVDYLQKVVVWAMNTSHALQIVESQIIGSPVVNFDTLPDGNLMVEFEVNPFEYYLFTGW